jgi:hypothetical protein
LELSQTVLQFLEPLKLNRFCENYPHLICIIYARWVFPDRRSLEKAKNSAIDSMNGKSGKHELFLTSLTILIAQNTIL